MLLFYAIDPALLRSGRIDKIVHCELPNAMSRLSIFKYIAEVSSLKFSDDVNLAYFCDSKSENYTGADIKSILVSANMIAVKESLAKCCDVSLQYMYIYYIYIFIYILYVK